MAKRSIQGYVELASGLGEMTKGAAKEAAAELVALTNGDLSPKKVTKQASKLADDLVAAANTNRKNLVSLVRSEVDKAVGRLDVNSLQQELSNVTDTVHALRGQVEELASTLAGRTSKAASGAATSAATLVGDAATDTAAAAKPATAPSRRPARSALKKSATKAPATKAPAKKAPRHKGVDGEEVGLGRHAREEGDGEEDRGRRQPRRRRPPLRRRRAPRPRRRRRLRPRRPPPPRSRHPRRRPPPRATTAGGA